MNLKKLLGVTLLLTPMLGVNDVYASRHNQIFRTANNNIDNTSNVGRMSNYQKPKVNKIAENDPDTIEIEEEAELSSSQLISDKEWAKIIEKAKNLKAEAITTLVNSRITEVSDIETLDSYIELFSKLKPDVLTTYYSILEGFINLKKIGYKQSCGLSDGFDFFVAQNNERPDIFYSINRNSFMGIVNSYVDYCKRNSIEYRESFRNLSASDPGDGIVFAPAITVDAPNSLLNWVEPITQDKIQTLTLKTANNYTLITELQGKTDNNGEQIQEQATAINDIQNDIVSVKGALENVPNMDDIYTKKNVDDQLASLQKELAERIENDVNDVINGVNNQAESIKTLKEEIDSMKNQITNLMSIVHNLQPQPFQSTVGMTNPRDRQTSGSTVGNNNSGRTITESQNKAKKISQSVKKKKIFKKKSDNLKDELDNKGTLNPKGRSATPSEDDNRPQSAQNDTDKISQPNNKIKIFNEVNRTSKKENIDGRSDDANKNSGSKEGDSVEIGSTKLVGNVTEESVRKLLAELGCKYSDAVIRKIKNSPDSKNISASDPLDAFAIKLGLRNDGLFSPFKTKNLPNLKKLHSLFFKN